MSTHESDGARLFIAARSPRDAGKPVRRQNVMEHRAQIFHKAKPLTQQHAGPETFGYAHPQRDITDDTLQAYQLDGDVTARFTVRGVCTHISCIRKRGDVQRFLGFATVHSQLKDRRSTRVLTSGSNPTSVRLLLSRHSMPSVYHMLCR
jgi:hypothetical protein